jgi:hypothetical protein
VVREWCLDAGTSVLNFFADLRAVLPVFELDFTIFVDRLIARWTGGILSMQESWNNLVSSLNLNDRFKIDTTDRAKDFQSQKERIGGLNYMREQAAGNLNKYAQDATPNAITNIATAPFNTATATAPTAQTWNMVQNIPQITINVAPGTPQVQAEALGRQTREATRDAHRAALQALEARGGK